MNPLEIIKLKRKHLARLANKTGADGETYLINEMEAWIPKPRGNGLRVLLAALAESGVVIKGTSFDAISLADEITIDFTEIESVRTALPKMTFIEIKTANQKRVRTDFSGFFFALTENEITAATALKSRYRVALYNKITGDILLTSVPEILARTKSMNWQLSVQL